MIGIGIGILVIARLNRQRVSLSGGVEATIAVSLLLHPDETALDSELVAEGRVPGGGVLLEAADDSGWMARWAKCREHQPMESCHDHSILSRGTSELQAREGHDTKSNKAPSF